MFDQRIDSSLWHTIYAWLSSMSNQPILPGLQWVIGGGFWHTFIVCLTICPIIPQLLGIVFVGYWAPWSPKAQFLAYMPGNVFLAGFIAGASTTFNRLVISWWLNWTILVSAFVFYVVLNSMDRGAYTTRQLWSANKVCHNSLYFWYGYLAVVCAISMWFGTDVSIVHKLCLTLSGLVWLGCLVGDNFASKHTQWQRFMLAHAGTYPIWRCWQQGVLIRRRTDTGYVVRPRAHERM